MSANELRSISLFLPGFSGGGAERVMISLASEFIASGFAVEVVVPTTSGALRTDAFELLPPESIVALDTGKVRWSIPALARYLRDRSPDALLVAPDDTAFFAVLARVLARGRSTALIAAVQNTLTLQTASLGRKRWLVAPALRWALGKADRVVAVSSGVASDLVENIRPTIKPIVILNPVDVTRINTMAKADVKHPWLTGEHDTLIAVGRLVEAKNFALLIRAFADVLNTRPNARLLVLGEGPLEQSLRQVTHELGLESMVDLVGFAQNPWAYMAKGSLFVLSSRFEGLPLVLVEALASGAQVVSTDCPSGPREILEDGRLGRLVPVDDRPALATAILDALEDPLPPVPLETVERRFSTKRIAQQYLSVIKAAFDERGAQ